MQGQCRYRDGSRLAPEMKSSHESEQKDLARISELEEGDVPGLSNTVLAAVYRRDMRQVEHGTVLLSVAARVVRVYQQPYFEYHDTINNHSITP